jgi:cytochrome c5
MKQRLYAAVFAASLCALGAVVLAPSIGPALSAYAATPQPALHGAGSGLVDEGRTIFRDDTFGDEVFWGGKLRLHDAIKGEKLGGVGGGVSPKTALAVGLKVDVDRLPPSLVEAIKAGKVDLDAPATTVALLQAKAVVGVSGVFDKSGLRSVGITCALCHSTVDNSVAPGIGHRRDGWPNRDLNVGAIVDLSPDLTVVQQLLGADRPTVDKVLQSWGPGKFDAALFLDGKAFRPDGKSGATLIPAAYGLAGVNLHTYTGWGSVPYWNGFVAVLEMHGQGNFTDARLDNTAQFPVAAKAGFGHVRNSPDLVSSKLAALQAYQLSLAPPPAPAGSFDIAAAARGQALFEGSARCGTCHQAPLFTEAGWNMHTGSEIGIDNFQADRSPDHRYRTTPLRGMAASRMKGGFYHDGRFESLDAVVEHYDDTYKLRLTPAQRRDLVEYLKSL